MRFVSISGDVKAAGVYEVPFGQTVRDLVFNTAGGMRDGQKAARRLPRRGRSGGFLPRAHQARIATGKIRQGTRGGRARVTEYDVLDLPLDLNTVGSHGRYVRGLRLSFTATAPDMVDNALNCVEFYRNESCGKCVPCSHGVKEKLVEMLIDLRAGEATTARVGRHRRAVGCDGDVTSICGLGQVAPNPITSVLKYFPEEVEKHLGRQ